MTETKTVKERMQQGVVQGWNRRNPIGTPVRYWPGVIKGPGVESVTRSEAWVMPSGDAVAMVEGYAGGIALTHIVPRGEAAPKRIQRKRTRGWRMPEGVVYVGRPSFWANPFAIGKVAAHRHRSGAAPYDFYIDYHQIVSADQAASLYRKIIADPTEHQYVGHDTPTTHAIRQELRGKDLACWCPLVDADGNRVPCHADELLKIANGADQ